MTPVHFSLLDPKTMKVSLKSGNEPVLLYANLCIHAALTLRRIGIFGNNGFLHSSFLKVNDLRQELECRGLNSKGLKSQLIARLTKTLKMEAEREEEGEAAVRPPGTEDDVTFKDNTKDEEEMETDLQKEVSI